ncbi:uncharacterized protein [Nicotiana sylvestris]|uniref:uncharacterized protein n=1 Tax=Nicotiana sylvestris TaxID=4096 RepID=UPI00388C7882
MTYKLDEDPSYPHVKQKKRKQGTFKNQIKSIEEIHDILSNKKEVQRLIGRIAALGRFISKSSEKCINFFSALKKQDHFEWNEECQQALRNLKTYLSNPPLLAKPKAGEKLLLYLAVSEVAVRVVLVREEQVLDPDVNEINFNNLTWDWRIEIVVFLQYGTVPDDKKKACELQRKVARYCLKQGNLYRKMSGGPLARCLGPSQTEYAIREVHEGHCGNQAGGRSLITELFQIWQIKRITSTPYHPVVNGQAELTNKIIINNLKKRLQEAKVNWPEVLPGVLWAYRTTAKTSTGETPFSLVYGAEALIPVEIGEPSTRFMHATEESNSEEMRVNLDLLEGRREAALIKMAAQKHVIERYYN